MDHQPGGVVAASDDHHHGTRDPRQQLINQELPLAEMFPWVQMNARDEQATREAMDSPPIGEQEMIHCAASRGNTVSVQAMLADGRINPRIQDRFGRTALHWAARQGHLETAVTLLKTGMWIDILSRSNATPLMLAALGGHDNVVRCLLRAGASAPIRGNQDPSCQLEWRTTALHYAARGGHIGVVTTLLNAGFHRDQPDEVGLIPAEISARASYASSPAVTRLLLGSGRGGPLIRKYVEMAIREDVEIVRGLVQAGAFLDWQDTLYRRTPLHRAVHCRHFQILKILLDAGANPNLADRHGVTPLHLVADSGCTIEAARLLEAGADTTSCTRDGYSPLHLAVALNRVGVARLLLGAPVSSIELRDHDVGMTPLSWASRIGYTPMLTVLLEAGADLESRSTGGLTPLHWACRSNAVETVESLLGAGADPEAYDDTGTDARSVISLGDPVGCTVPQSSPFRSVVAFNEGERRPDSAAAGRIRMALEIAKKDRTWSRRGWLIILAGRRAMAAGSTRLDLSAGSSSPTTCSLVGPIGIDGGGDDIVRRHLVGAEGEQRDEVTGGPYHGSTVGCNDVRWPSDGHETESLCDGPVSLPHESRGETVECSSQANRSACPSGPTSSGVAGCVEDGVGSTLGSGTVEALLGLAPVNKGVFRNVICFI